MGDALCLFNGFKSFFAGGLLAAADGKRQCFKVERLLKETRNRRGEVKTEIFEKLLDIFL